MKTERARPEKQINPWGAAPAAPWGAICTYGKNTGGGRGSDSRFTLLPRASHVLPRRYKCCYRAILHVQRWWNWYTNDRITRQPKDAPTKYWRMCTNLPISLSALCATKGCIWEVTAGWGEGFSCGVQGTIMELPGALPQRSPATVTVWAYPQLQIHDHLSLRSTSSHVPHVMKNKLNHNSQSLLRFTELLLRQEKFR